MSRPAINHNISFDESNIQQQPRRQQAPQPGQYAPNQQQQSQRQQGPPVPRKGSVAKSDGATTYTQNVPTLGYEEAGYGAGFSGAAGAGADVRRKKSMVRPERERIEPGHRHYHYREHAADDNIPVQPSGELFYPPFCCLHHLTPL